MVRGAMAALLSMEADLEVVAQVATGDAVVPEALRTRPDVAVLDIEMPAMDGLAAAAALRTALPGCRVLIVTTFGRPGYLRQALEAGALGFVLKDAPASELASAIRAVASGRRVVDPALALDALSEGSNPLSEREREVLGAATEQATVADIAASMSLSEGTVRNHLSAAIQKVGARNRAEAARIAQALKEGRYIGEAAARQVTVDVPRLRPCQRLPRRAPCALDSLSRREEAAPG